MKMTYFSWLNLNPPDEASTFPIEKADASLTFYTKKQTARKTFCLKANIQASALFELLEQFDTRARLSNRIVRRILVRSPARWSVDGIDKIGGYNTMHDQALSQRLDSSMPEQCTRSLLGVGRG